MSEGKPVSIDELMVRRLAARIAELEMQNAVLAATLEMVGLQMNVERAPAECTCAVENGLDTVHSPDCPEALTDEPIAG